jgi:hypothetical protein
MKTTMYIEDELFRRAKAEAVLEGKTLKQFVEESLRAMLNRSSGRSVRSEHWIDRLPSLPNAAVAELNKNMNAAGFREVDKEMWS